MRISFDVVEYGKLGDISRGVPDFSEIEYTPALRHNGFRLYQLLSFKPHTPYARTHGAFTAGLFFTDRTHMSFVEAQRRNEYDITNQPGRAYDHVRFSVFDLQEISHGLESGIVPYISIIKQHYSENGFGLQLQKRQIVHQQALTVELQEETLCERFRKLVTERWAPVISASLVCVLKGQKVRIVAHENVSILERLELASMIQILSYQIPLARVFQGDEQPRRYLSFQLEPFCEADSSIEFVTYDPASEAVHERVIANLSRDREVLIDNGDNEFADAQGSLEWLLEDLFRHLSWSEGLAKLHRLACERWKRERTLLSYPLPSHFILKFVSQKGGLQVEDLESLLSVLSEKGRSDEVEEVASKVLPDYSAWFASGIDLAEIVGTFVKANVSPNTVMVLIDGVLVDPNIEISFTQAIDLYIQCLTIQPDEYATLLLERLVSKSTRIGTSAALYYTMQKVPDIQKQFIVSTLLLNNKDEILSSLLRADLEKPFLTNALPEVIKSARTSHNQVLLLDLWRQSAPAGMRQVISVLPAPCFEYLNRESLEYISSRIRTSDLLELPLNTVVEFRRSVRKVDLAIPLQLDVLRTLVDKAKRSQELDHLQHISLVEIPLYIAHAEPNEEQKRNLCALFDDCLSEAKRIGPIAQKTDFGTISALHPTSSLFQLCTDLLGSKTDPETTLFIFACVVKRLSKTPVQLSGADLNRSIGELRGTAEHSEFFELLWTYYQSRLSELTNLSDQIICEFLRVRDRQPRLKAMLSNNVTFGQVVRLLYLSGGPNDKDWQLLYSEYRQLPENWIENFPIDIGDAWLSVWKTWQDEGVIYEFLDRYPQVESGMLVCASTQGRVLRSLAH